MLLIDCGDKEISGTTSWPIGRTQSHYSVWSCAFGPTPLMLWQRSANALKSPLLLVYRSSLRSLSSKRSIHSWSFLETSTAVENVWFVWRRDDFVRSGNASFRCPGTIRLLRGVSIGWRLFCRLSSILTQDVTSRVYTRSVCNRSSSCDQLCRLFACR